MDAGMHLEVGMHRACEISHHTHLRVTTIWGTVLPAQSCRPASHLLQLFPGQVEREDTAQCDFHVPVL
ncbi:hypothetical protein BDA96_07G030400 [Sorghum bicolor]|uniref:Uncharacterized protein n=1 Tax=Sorghum bicolor TaxID=4558 RepID=A0A921QIS9_SORBI|nr:hypothetical protein BDA96_07G030400 [Sorghum bicolor]